MAVLYGRAGRLTTKHGGFRPGQWADKKKNCKDCGHSDFSGTCEPFIFWGEIMLLVVLCGVGFLVLTAAEAACDGCRWLQVACDDRLSGCWRRVSHGGRGTVGSAGDWGEAKPGQVAHSVPSPIDAAAKLFGQPEHQSFGQWRAQAMQNPLAGSAAAEAEDPGDMDFSTNFPKPTANMIQDV